MNKRLHNSACKDFTWHSKIKKSSKKHASRMLRRKLNREVNI